MTTDGNSRRANANPGTSVTGRLLREWCVNASSDERDWFSVGDRMRATQAFAAQVEVAKAQGSKRIRVPSALILLDGPRGAGKSAIADYFASQFKYGGAEVYHSGCFGYGRVLEEREWYTAINNVIKGSVVFIDETHSVNRQGRDQADIQGIMNEQFAALRKQECLVFCASAMASRIGRVLREMADEIWRPQKMRVELSDRERRRRRRQRVKAKDDPANYAYCVYRATGQPYRAGSIFDEVLGEDRDGNYRSPIHRRRLDPRWMRMVMPLLDTFRPVPIGAALAVNREAVIDLATGRVPQAHDKDRRLWETIGHLTRAFRSGDLPVPPVPPPGTLYVPAYMSPTSIRNATATDLSLQAFSVVLRDGLRLDNNGGRGYELLELYETVEQALEEFNDEHPD